MNYPHRVTVQVNDKNFQEIYIWLFDNLNPHAFSWGISNNRRTMDYLFQSEEDAALFALTWQGSLNGKSWE